MKSTVVLHYYYHYNQAVKSVNKHLQVVWRLTGTADVVCLESSRSSRCFSQLCSFNWRQAGEYVNEGWHSLVHDNSRGQTHVWVPRRLRRSSSSSSLMLQIQLVAHFNSGQIREHKTTHNQRRPFRVKSSAERRKHQ